MNILVRKAKLRCRIIKTEYEIQIITDIGLITFSSDTATIFYFPDDVVPCLFVCVFNSLIFSGVEHMYSWGTLDEREREGEVIGYRCGVDQWETCWKMRGDNEKRCNIFKLTVAGGGVYIYIYTLYIICIAQQVNFEKKKQSHVMKKIDHMI